MKLGVEQKKWLHLIQPSQDPTYIYFFLIQGLRVRVEMGTKSEKVCMCVCMWRFFVGVYFTLYLQGPKSLLAQIWCGAFYIWGIDGIKFLWRLGEGVGS